MSVGVLTCGVVPAERGIYTAPDVDCSGAVEEVLDRIGRSAAQATCTVFRCFLDANTRFPVVFIQAFKVDAEGIRRNGFVLKLPENFFRRTYVTFDVDAPDSAVMRATGTPGSGGLQGYHAMWLPEQIMKTRQCIGFDVVEPAPIGSLHASLFAEPDGVCC